MSTLTKTTVFFKNTWPVVYNYLFSGSRYSKLTNSRKNKQIKKIEHKAEGHVI